MRKILYEKYLWISLSIHLLFWFGIALSFNETYSPQPKFEVSSYVYQEPAHAKNLISESKYELQHPSHSTQRNKNHSIQKIKLKKILAKNKFIKKNSQDLLKLEQTLLAILHAAIAEKQTYPKSAVVLQQSGTVKIGFLISRKGTLTNISLLNSSGYSSLDKAALWAVKAASPIKPAVPFLEKEKYFSVNVIFAATDN